MRKIYSLFIFLSLISGMSNQVEADDEYIPEYFMLAGNDLRIDLDYLFGENHGYIRIRHEEGAFDEFSNESEFWLRTVPMSYSGIIIIDDGINTTYKFRLNVVEPLDSNGINQIQTLNLLSYEE